MRLKLVIQYLLCNITLQLFGIMANIQACPTGCSCPDKTSLECNGISQFPNLTATAYNFTQISFSDCEFKNNIMPQIPASYAQITKLSLRNCTGTITDDSLALTKKLLVLKITGNRPLIFNSSSPFQLLDDVDSLDLSDNELTALPVKFCSGLRQLAVINLSHNQLKEIPKDAFISCKRHLMDVYFQNNMLTMLSYDHLPWTQLNYVNASDNPWMCNCSLHWVVETMEDNFWGASCALPENLSGKDLYEAEKELSCGPSGSTVALGIGIPILIVCLVVLGYCAYKAVRNHRNRRRLRSSVKYSTVYGETVESNPRQMILM